MLNFFFSGSPRAKQGVFKSLFCLTSFLLFFMAAISPAVSQNTNNTETRDISGFTGISLDIHADLYITQDNNYSVQIEGKQEVLDQIVTEKNGDNLVIKNKNNKWHSNGEDQLKITVHLPKLNSLEVNGSGNVVAQTDFSTDKMHLEINGSGNLKMMSVTAGTLSAVINGSGNITQIKGDINDVDLTVNGSGNMNAESVTGKTVSVSIAGSGDITVGVSDKLDVDIEGSGNVYYKGNPSSVKKEVVGSGGVTQR